MGSRVGYRTSKHRLPTTSPEDHVGVSAIAAVQRGRMQPPRHVPRWLLRTASEFRPYRHQVARFAEAGLAMATLACSLNGLANRS